jgi:beta-glucosidase
MTNFDIKKQAQEMLAKMTPPQKVAQLQCMFVGSFIPKEILYRFPNGIGALALMIGTGGKEVNAKDGAEQQDIVIKNCGIPVLRHVEALTGVLASDTTIFPAAIGMGATWNPGLVEKMADIARKQMVSIGIRHALSPVMDVARDPRWGRVGETYGEDPTLCAALSVAFTKGLQSDDLQNGAAATGKHFLGYGMSQGGLNMAANSIGARELREVYAKPFQAAITEANLATVMNSYGTVDNDLVVGSKNIMTDLLRDEMGFDGTMVADYMSIDRMIDLKLSENPCSAAIRALEAGLDVEFPKPFGYTDALLAAVEEGRLDIKYVDRAVLRILELKIKLGLIESPYGKAEWLDDAYNTKLTRPFSLQAARESAVLLKNDGLLPLSKNTKKIAVIGPHADSLRLLFGCYTFPAQLDRDMSGSMSDMPGMSAAGGQRGENPNQMPYFQSCSVRGTAPIIEETIRGIYADRTPTILVAIKAKCPDAEIVYAKGCDVAGTDQSGFGEAKEAAESADVAVVILGGKYGWGTNCTTGEGIDCDNIGLPGVQEELARTIIESGVPTVIVHMDSKPLSSEYIAEHSNAVLEYWFPGETGGTALADILFGDYNPSGKLPMTAARNAGQIPIHSGTQNGSGYFPGDGMVISKYAEGTKEPLYYFGEGKSYTTFEYSGLTVDERVAADGIVNVSVDITNTGNVYGEEIVQVYVSDELASMIRPAQELAGFYRVKLATGETKRVIFQMRSSQFAFLDLQMKWLVEAGTMTVKVGSSSHNIRLTGSFGITDSKYIDGKNRGFYAKASER